VRSTFGAFGSAIALNILARVLFANHAGVMCTGAGIESNMDNFGRD
jgi:hypothetical protein